jgi:hypothetical protein
MTATTAAFDADALRHRFPALQGGLDGWLDGRS